MKKNFKLPTLKSTSQQVIESLIASLGIGAIIFSMSSLIYMVRHDMGIDGLALSNVLAVAASVTLAASLMGQNTNWKLSMLSGITLLSVLAGYLSQDFILTFSGVASVSCLGFLLFVTFASDQYLMYEWGRASVVNDIQQGTGVSNGLDEITSNRLIQMWYSSKVMDKPGAWRTAQNYGIEASHKGFVMHLFEQYIDNLKEQSRPTSAPKGKAQRATRQGKSTRAKRVTA